MATAEAAIALLRLAQDLRTEIAAIAETVEDARRALAELQSREPTRLELYGAASIAASFYTGVEKVFERIAPELNGGVPAGGAWHRRLLENMTLEIPGVRPRLVARETAEALDAYLSFRHRFRNLYMFDLRWDRVRPVLVAMPDVWTLARRDLDAFAAWLDQVGRG